MKFSAAQVEEYLDRGLLIVDYPVFSLRPARWLQRSDKRPP